MASVFRKKGSPYYYAAFADSDGTRAQRSTKQTKPAEALKIAAEWEKLAAKGRRGSLTESQVRRVVSDIFENISGEAVQFHTCRGWLTEWTAGRKGAVSDGTLTRYEQVTADFIEYLGARADLSLAAISLADIRGYRDKLKNEGRAASTVNLHIKKVLNVPFSAAARLGYIQINPCAAVESLRTEEASGRDVFSPAQIAELVMAAEGDWRGAVLTAYYTGLRLSDVANIQWRSIDLQKRLIVLKTGKTGAEVYVPIHADLEEWLRKAVRGIGKAPVFPSLAGKSTGGAGGLSAQFTKLIRLAKIKRTVIRQKKGAGHQTSNLSFHSLRHTFISSLANAGVSSEIRQKLSGHADEQTHQRYTHHQLETLRAAVEKMPGLGA